MQITDVKHFLANPGRGKNLCFVKVETDEGIYGWGEALYAVGPRRAGDRAY